jgi:hypothetical protein
MATAAPAEWVEWRTGEESDKSGEGEKITYVAGEVLGALVLASAAVDGHDLVLGAGLLQRRHAPRHVPRHRRAVQLHRSHAFSLCLYSPLSSARFRSDPVFSPVLLRLFNRRRVW